MNNFSPLGIPESDERLSRPEAAAPTVVNPALQARQHKLRRIVGWVVGGAALLMCAGLVRAATRSHSDETVASEPALNATGQAAVATALAPATAAAPDQAAANPSTAQAVAPSATPSAAPAPVAQKPNHKPSAGGFARSSKTPVKRPSAAKSPIARNW
ncbi:MAG TPA: hypothetical protein VK745_24615 [Polyangiaceae bacterium]|nr:hypothetical protein [Polyangiaceae bacterium]